MFVEKTESIFCCIFTDGSLGIFSLIERQFVKRISDINFSKSFMDDALCYAVQPEMREKGLDFYWFKYTNQHVVIPKPDIKTIVPIPVKRVLDKPPEKPSSSCLIF